MTAAFRGKKRPNKTEAQQALDAAHDAAGGQLPCKLDPDAWYPPEPVYTTARQAITWCHTCPALDACRTWAHTKPVETESVILGGEWWTQGRVTNPWPQRNRKQVAA